MSARRPVTAFAPATVGNLGPGFEILGLALEGPGCTVAARFAAGPGVRLAEIEGNEAGERGERERPSDAAADVATLAAAATLRRAGVDAGVAIEVVTGLPIGSGLGATAAGAAAAAYAVNLLLGSPLRRVELMAPCLDAEGDAAGHHAGNVAAALLGGLILVHTREPLDLVRLPVPEGLAVVVVTPQMEQSDRDARSALPDGVPWPVLVANGASVAALVAACHSGDLALLGRALKDAVASPARSRLIPGCDAVLAAALDAGALGASVSGDGPSLFALCRSPHSAGDVARAMVAAFARAGLPAGATISPADCPGARRV